MSLQEKLQKNRDFWEGNPMEYPLVIVRTGDVFPAKRMRANDPLLKRGRSVLPEDLQPENYAEDYLSEWMDFEKIGQDGIYTAEPCNGFPWMEAILGAEIVGGEDAFIARPCCRSIEELDRIVIDKGNPWYQKYLEFSEMLVKLAQGRFPVAQPILRGGSDTIGALVGQEEMACGLLEEPERVKRLFLQVAELQRELVADQLLLTPTFHHGRSIGFYHLWTPGNVIWYQDDLTALLSPRHYETFLKESAERICEGYAYTMMHLHPASFHLLDNILSIKTLKAVQINKDVGGPSVKEMLPYCRRVLECGKKLILGMGFLDENDIDAITSYLPNQGVALVLVAADRDRAEKLLNYIADRSGKK